MKRFILQSLLFAVITGAILIAGEYAVRTVPNPYGYKHRWMLQNGNTVETLFLGSSHIYYGISPECWEGASFNLANVSQGFKYDYILLSRYADACPSLRSVVLRVSYASFFDAEFEDSDEWWYAINYKLYMDVNLHSDFSKYNYEMAYFPIYVRKVKSFLSGNKSLLECDSLGLGLDFSSANKSAEWESADKAVKRHTAADWRAVDDNRFWLREIASYCRARDIDLILVTTPTWNTYYNSLDDRQLCKMYEIIDDILSEYDNVSYFDYLKDPRFEASDFYDCDHLSADIGARKFTRILRKDIDAQTTLRQENSAR